MSAPRFFRKKKASDTVSLSLSSLIPLCSLITSIELGRGTADGSIVDELSGSGWDDSLVQLCCLVTFSNSCSEVFGRSSRSVDDCIDD